MTGHAPELVVWRHGRSEWNAGGRFQGQLESPLDEVGRTEARLAAARLATLEPAAIVASDSGRARETAAVLAGLTGLPVERDPRLREVDLGAWSGLTAAEAAARFPGEYADWQAGRDVPRGGGETFAAAGERARVAVEERLAAHAGGPLVVVTHGGTGRSLLVALLGLPPEARALLAPLANARWAALVRARGGWALAAYNAGVDAPVDPAAVAPDDAVGAR